MVLNKNIKLLILDVDGVMTDGTKSYDIKGNTTFKQFNDKDFTAIKRFKSSGVQVVFLSGDDKVNKEIAKNRNIPFYFSKGKTKDKFINIFKKEYKIGEDNMVYVGDDYFDLPIMRKLYYSYCTTNSPNIIKEQCVQILTRKGGDGVVAELYDLYEEFSLLKTNENELFELDRKDIF